jgi:hypothetical protein
MMADLQTTEFPERARMSNENFEKLELVDNKTLNHLVTSQEACAVCMAVYDEDDLVIQTPCKHVFHGPCLRPWVTEKRSCPNCRSSIDEELLASM